MTYTLEVRDLHGDEFELLVAGDKDDVIRKINELTAIIPLIGASGTDFKDLRVRGWKYGKIIRSMEGSDCGNLDNYLSLIGT